tara:strand:+ start:149 stop:535 length:387 start_codon:yes stop_codon:yes gene_type:complete
MSNKLLEAAILRLRSNIMATAAKIEALLSNPLSVGGDFALEAIEMEIIKLGQFEMALAALRKRFPPHEALGAEEKRRSPAPRPVALEEKVVESVVKSKEVAPAMADDFKQLIARRGPQTKTRLPGEKK